MPEGISIVLAHDHTIACEALRARMRPVSPKRRGP
jgi:hypothetical protein